MRKNTILRRDAQAAGAVQRRTATNLLARRASVNVEARTFEATAVTETPVRRHIELEGMGYVPADEVLVVSALDLARAADGIPLLDGHDTSTTDSVLGSIIGARTETVDGLGEVLVLTARVSEGERGDQILARLADGSLSAVSVGYRVAQYEVQPREGQAPVARAIQWSLAELSLVPVGADPNARVRSADPAPTPPAPANPAPTATPPAPAPADDLAPILEAASALARAVEALSQRRAAPPAAPTQVPAAVVPNNPAPTPPTPAAQTPTAPAPAIRTEDVYAALRGARGEDAAATTIRTLCRNANLGPLGEDLVRIGASVEEARVAIREALVQRSVGGGEVATRSAPGPEGVPTPRIDPTQIYARLAATHNRR